MEKHQDHRYEPTMKSQTTRTDINRLGNYSIQIKYKLSVDYIVQTRLCQKRIIKLWKHLKS
jgi:hypothetical protein